MPRCPVCDVPVVLDALSSAPFCSDRCRLVDLGRWLDEAYAAPDRPRSADDEDADGYQAGSPLAEESGPDD